MSFPGMYIAQAIVTRMQGENIRVESVLGVGSTFTLILPMKMANGDFSLKHNGTSDLIRTVVKGLPCSSLTALPSLRLLL